MRAAFVGRRDELAAFERFVDDALDGRPSLVLCRGEPGIGKTRLAHELTRIASERGVPAAWGTAVEAEGAPPYWPWRQVIRDLARILDLDSVVQEADVAADLGSLLPAGAGSDRPASAEDRFRQFDAVSRLLAAVTARTPLVVVLDDSHWADQASVLLLQHVVRSVRDERIVLMVNHRNTEHAHAALFAELGRDANAQHVDLTGLTAGDVATLLGSEASPNDVDQVVALTNGNPFFVGEIRRALPAAKVTGALAPVTADLREAIRSRLARLSPDAVRFAHAAAVIGRDFQMAVVARMVGASMLACLPWMDEAVAAGLIEEGTTPGEHRFVHALVKDAIETGLSAAERVDLHRSAADAIAAVHAAGIESHLADIAHHHALAVVDGERGVAAGWLMRSADEAMRSLAYEEAARQYTLALELGSTEIDEETRCVLLIGLARATNAFIDLSTCIDASVRAVEIALAIGRTDLAVEAALVHEAIGPTRSEATSRELCERVLAYVPDEDRVARARLLARHGEASFYVCWLTAHDDADYDAPRRTSEQALTLAENSGDPTALAAALRARRMACSEPESLDEREHLAERMSALGRATNDPRAEMWGSLWRIDAAFMRGDLARVGREIELLASSVERVRGPHARYELEKTRAVLAQAQGRFADAMRLAASAFATIAHTGDMVGFQERAGLLHQIGLQIGLEASGAIEASGFADTTVFDRELPRAGVIVAIANAHALAGVGRLDEARAIYESMGPVGGWQPSPHAILPALTFGLNLAMVLERAGDVAVLRERLSAYRGYHVVSGAGQVAYFGPVELWVGRAAAFLGEPDEAVADLSAAVEICTVSGAAGYAVEARYELGSILAARGDPQARTLLDVAAQQARALGMTPFIPRIEKVKIAPDNPLTPREWEVARLVADGKTNREIAAALYLSDRTAQNHVQHILTKLGLANRSQIAAWMTKREMSTPSE